jgi:hypothetical protein
MDYAAEDKRSPTTEQQTKFSAVQHQIMKTMMGCFRTTSTDALQNETSLLSPYLLLREKVLKSVTHCSPTAPPASLDPTSPQTEMAEAILPYKFSQHRQNIPRMHA